MIEAITSDDYLIVVANPPQMSAVKISDGAITPLLKSGDVFPPSSDQRSPVVLIGDDTDLSAWSSASGLHLLSTSSDKYGYYGAVDVTSDGKYIAYLDQADFAKRSANVVIDAPDHSSPKVVATVNYPPSLKFAGGRLIAWHQAPGDSNGPGTTTSYDPASGVGIDLFPSDGSDLQTNDQSILASLAPGQLSLVPLAGGKPLLLVDMGLQAGTAEFVAGGSAVLYRDTMAGLYRVNVGGGQPIFLQRPGFDGSVCSPDGKFVTSPTSTIRKATPSIST